MDGNKVRTSSLWNHEGSLSKESKKVQARGFIATTIAKSLHCIQLSNDDKRLKLLNETSALSEPINVTFLVPCALLASLKISLSLHSIQLNILQSLVVWNQWDENDFLQMRAKFLFRKYFSSSSLLRPIRRGSNCAILWTENRVLGLNF